MLREWDPSTASPSELAAVVETMNVVRTTDLPQDPAWCNRLVREYFAATLPGERRVTWVARPAGAPGSGPPAFLGYATLLITDELGVLEVVVRPEVRGNGIGTQLLTAAVTRAAEEGVQSLGVEVVGGTPSVFFYEAHGFRHAYTELRYVLTLSDVDWPKIEQMAGDIGAGYRVEFYPGGPPAELYPAYAAAKEAVRDLPHDDLDLRPSSCDPGRLAASISTLRARGLTPYVVVAVHERSETVAGLTEVVVPAQCPQRADQYDTIVVPKHSSYGIDRAIRARLLLELRSADPGLVDVQTWNAAEQAHMVNINTELGFRQDRQWREYDVDVSTLLNRLRQLA